MPLPLQRAIVAVVSTVILIPWVWRRVWTAAGAIEWQADLDADVVPDDVWNNIVAVIQGDDAFVEADVDDDD